MKIITSTSVTIVILACLLSAFPTNAEASGRLYYEAQGYSIVPMEGSYPENGVIFLKGSFGFTPNVNVVIQQYDGNMNQFLEISRKQFEANGFKIISETQISRSITAFEYLGKGNGKDFHCYARCVNSSSKYYVITGMALTVQWPKVGSSLKTCVDSFELIKKSWF